MTEQDDEELAVRARSGDDAAFAELLRRYLSPIGTFLYQLVRDREVTDDLVQETFVKAWRNLHRFDSGKRFRTWLYAIARNTAFDHFRKRKELPFASVRGDGEDDGPLDEIADERILPSEALEREDAAKELEEKLAVLQPGYRAILLLHFREDFSLREIAEIQGESYNTTKSRYLRAVKSLRKAFALDGAPENDLHP